MTYCTVEQVREHLQITAVSFDDLIQRAIDASVEWVDAHTERGFAVPTVETVRVYEAGHPYRLAVSDIANTTGLIVKHDAGDNGTFNITWTAADYELLPVDRRDGWPYTTVSAVGGQQFPTGGRRAGRVQITARHGWPTTPDAVIEATILVASRVFNRRLTPDGTAGISDFGAVRVTRVDPDVMTLLNPYRRWPVKTAAAWM